MASKIHCLGYIDLIVIFRPFRNRETKAFTRQCFERKLIQRRRRRAMIVSQFVDILLISKRDFRDNDPFCLNDFRQRLVRMSQSKYITICFSHFSNEIHWENGIIVFFLKRYEPYLSRITESRSVRPEFFKRKTGFSVIGGIKQECLNKRSMK